MQPPTDLSRARSRRPGNPYRVLVSLLYARFAWVEHLPDGSLTANSTRFARALGLRTYRLREALLELKDLGFLDRLVWHHGWFLAKPTSPRNFARVLNDIFPEPSGPRIHTQETFQRAMAICETFVDIEAEKANERHTPD